MRYQFIEMLWLGSFTGLNFFEPQTTQANKSPPKITSNICMNFDPLLNMESNFHDLEKNPRNPRCVLQKMEIFLAVSSNMKLHLFRGLFPPPAAPLPFSPQVPPHPTRPSTWTPRARHLSCPNRFQVYQRGTQKTSKLRME